uniref:Mitochondrial thiamine pyrophosphate carrier 1 n=1 Tax=Lygus hesperus TaxID=30085 RepID=A0A0A9Y2U2_LYGHE
MYILFGSSCFYTEQRVRKCIQDHTLFRISTASLVSGSIAGAIGTTVSYPFDCIRTRLAAVPNTQHLQLCQVLRTTYRYSGVKGFYDGLLPSLVGIVPYMGLQFSIYHT